MKAFSPEMFTEQAQASLRQEAYNILEQKKDTIETYLEAEDAALEMEINAKRKYYISLIESKNQNLELIDEVAGIALIAAIIAGVVLILKKVAKSMSESNILKAIERKAEEELTYTPTKNNAPNTKVQACKNPYLNRDIQKGKIGKLSFSEFDKLASTANVEIKDYQIPDEKLLTGSIPECEKLEQAMKSMQSGIKSISLSMYAEGLNDFNEAKKLSSEIVDGMKAYDSKGSEDTKSINAREYLSKSRPWIVSVDSKKGYVFDINRYNANKVAGKLLITSTGLLETIKKTNFASTVPEDSFSKMKECADAIRSASKEVTSKLFEAIQVFWKMVSNDIAQMNKVVSQVSNTGNVEESAIFENEFYQNSPELQEYMFGKDTTLSESYSEYYQEIDNMITRASILTHKYQMRAMNEEALIFSENISDYEKFQRLQAVNEALADKVKRGWYNAVAAVKEIFRKFTEKLTANFTTTKNYMDRYKNIILNADFNPNDTYKTQDLGKGIDRIYDDMVIKLNFNDVATTDFSTVGQCFDKFFTKGMGASAGPNVKVPGENASIGDINEYFKTFFCMQGNDHTYTGKEFQQHIKKFYDFLYDIRKINKSIKDGIREVEDNANRIMKQAGLDVNKPATNTTADQTAAPQTAPATSQPAPAAESVYSILYQKYFTLNENGVLVEADINNAGSGTNRAVNNVGKGNTEDDTQTIRNTEKGTVDTKVKAYTDICVSMLKAKMSACEFIRNELMQIIRNHVQAHIGNKAANPQQPQQQQNQQQQTQQPQQQAQQQTQQAKPTFGQRVRNAANALRGQ